MWIFFLMKPFEVWNENLNLELLRKLMICDISYAAYGLLKLSPRFISMTENGFQIDASQMTLINNQLPAPWKSANQWKSSNHRFETMPKVKNSSSEFENEAKSSKQPPKLGGLTIQDWETESSTFKVVSHECRVEGHFKQPDDPKAYPSHV